MIHYFFCPAECKNCIVTAVIGRQVSFAEVSAGQHRPQIYVIMMMMMMMMMMMIMMMIIRMTIALKGAI